MARFMDSIMGRSNPDNLLINSGSRLSSGDIFNTMPGTGINAGAGATAAFDPSIWDRIAGYEDTNTGIQHGGIAGPVMAGINSLLGGYLGFKQLGLAEDSLKENRRQFDLNFGAQRKLTNSRLRDRQRARVASNPNAYEGADSYMARAGI